MSTKSSEMREMRERWCESLHEDYLSEEESRAVRALRVEMDAAVSAGDKAAVLAIRDRFLGVLDACSFPEYAAWNEDEGEWWEEVGEPDGPTPDAVYSYEALIGPVERMMPLLDGRARGNWERCEKLLSVMADRLGRPAVNPRRDGTLAYNFPKLPMPMLVSFWDSVPRFYYGRSDGWGADYERRIKSLLEHYGQGSASEVVV